MKSYKLYLLCPSLPLIQGLSSLSLNVGQIFVVDTSIIRLPADDWDDHF